MLRFFMLLLPLFLTSDSAPTITLYGQVKDQDGKAVQGVHIYTEGKGCGLDSVLTDAKGRFVFTGVERKDWHYVYMGKKGYLQRSYTIWENKNAPSDSIVLNATLRERKVLMLDSVTLGKRCLGLRLKDFFKRYSLDSNECRVVMEPHGILRGVRTELGDSTCLWVQVPRECGRWMRDIWKVKVTGIGLAYMNGKTRFYGTDFVWSGIWNPYWNK
jgi:hypothetical protein